MEELPAEQVREPPLLPEAQGQEREQELPLPEEEREQQELQQPPPASVEAA